MPNPTHSLNPDRGRVIFLGTGTSVGVPAIGCECDVCQSDDPRNNRTRCSIVVDLPKGRLLIDTPPDLRTQLLREKINLIHAVLFTHEHADHLYGLDDVRLFPFRLGAAIPLYCQKHVEQRIRQVYDYAFTERPETHAGSVPNLEFRTIEEEPFELLGATVIPIPMRHGPYFNVLGFRIGDFAYCTDTNGIPDDSYERLKGVKTFVVDALRYDPHPTHFTVDEAIEAARRVGAESTLFTHISHHLDYKKATRELPNGVSLAYDGLRINFSVGK